MGKPAVSVRMIKWTAVPAHSRLTRDRSIAIFESKLRQTGLTRPHKQDTAQFALHLLERFWLRTGSVLAHRGRPCGLR